LTRLLVESNQLINAKKHTSYHLSSECKVSTVDLSDPMTDSGLAAAKHTQTMTLYHLLRNNQIHWRDVPIHSRFRK